MNNTSILFETTKRILDIVISVCALVLFLPFALLVSIFIILEDGLPVIYIQDRVGRNRELFKLYKFRSMVKNADEILFSDSKLYEAMRSGSHKLENDHRITKAGRFIRKYSIDEFPQFLNVLRGEMSVVGPRAYRPDELEKYESENPHIRDSLDKIQTVKPGITGLWQVSGRSSVPFHDMVLLDLYYINRWSLSLDIEIVLKTIPVVLSGKGAY